ncbi:MAG: bifunctional UDP-N-acetylglucosamine diphosphorylase/glucosamine-1-phosphate N-acetyltransferase GlmU [Alphaproteobacteria bacterium]|nr:bifunctional UDP-N-acetylglucosamine diphosphorylase/glucosamine-1-phosphate N-acetyltransferase GlmU [Alphaproteobacteria bacterium]
MTKPKTAVIILTAGASTRMKSSCPKVLHPLAGRPMIEQLLETARGLAPERLVVVVGPKMEAVADAVAPAVTVVQETPLGTGHAVMAARGELEGFDGPEDRVLILCGDTPLVTEQSLEALVQALDGDSPPAVAVLGMRVTTPHQYGRLVTIEGGALEAIVEDADCGPEERENDLCNSGVMAVRGEHLFGLLEAVGNDNAKGEYYLTDMVAQARQQNLTCVYREVAESELLGINSRAELARAEAVLQGRLRAAAMEGGVTMSDPDTVWLSFDTAFGQDVTVEPDVFFGPGVTVGDGVQIRGFCHMEGVTIADGAVVGPFARLRPETKIGKSAHVGNFVEIKKSEIGEGAKVNHLSYVGDAVVGAAANIGAGTITCNYDGFTKSLTKIGKGAFIGSNTALVAPVNVGAGAMVGAGSVISRDVAAEALAVTRSPQTEQAGWAASYRERHNPQKPQKPKKKG